jgi:hypothetical protein
MCRIDPNVLRELIRLKIVITGKRGVTCGNLLARDVDTPDGQGDLSEFLSLGIPPSIRATDEFRQHLFWWPDGVPTEALIGVASSRLSRSLEDWTEWFRGLRSLAAHCDGARQRLLVVASSSTAMFVERSAELFGKSTLLVETTESGTLQAWWERIQRLRGSSSQCPQAVRQSKCETDVPGQIRLFVSPCILDSAGHASSLRDRLLIALASQLTALYVSDRGNTKPLISQRVASPVFAPRATRLLLSHHTNPATTQELLNLGCVGWHITAASRDSDRPRKGRTKNVRQPIDESKIFGGRTWLTHCTRRRVGPWPQQPTTHYLDELIFEEPSADRSARAAIEQIVTTQRLLASQRGVRGDVPVVCFTAVPLHELQGLNVFRPHRGRWDFQPYGVCIDKDWLVGQGARPVNYATDAEWDQLSADDRPFFQIEKSITRSGNEIDWTVEEEWRVTGDVDLAKVPQNQIVVFVFSEEEATRLRRMTQWSVVVQRSVASSTE